LETLVLVVAATLGVVENAAPTSAALVTGNEGIGIDGIDGIDTG